MTSYRNSVENITNRIKIDMESTLKQYLIIEAYQVRGEFVMVAILGPVTRPLTFSVVAVSALALAGCSVVNPYRDGDNSAYEESVSLTSAVAYAESTRERYYYNVKEQTFINKATGVALVGAAAAAAFFGIQGNHSTLVTGLGVGGAGLFGVNSLLYSYPRLGVYVAGAKAVSCAISLYAPFGSYFRNDFEASVTELEDQVVLVRQLVVQTSDPTGTNKFFANQVLSDADKTLQNSVKIEVRLGSAGVQLYETVQVIHANVSQEILKHEPNLDEVIKDIGKNLQVNANYIINTQGVKNTPDTVATPESVTVSSRGSPENLKAESRTAATPTNLARQAQILRNMRNAMEIRISEFKDLPQDTDLQACAEFETLRPLLVLPQPTLTVNLKEGSGGVVRVSGGKRPYSYGWVGPAPSTGVKLDHKPFTTERMGWEIMVSGEGAVPNQNLQLVVQDSAEEMKTVMVNITGTDAKPPDAPTPTSDTPVLRSNATVAILQDRLISLGCMAGTRQVNGRNVTNSDGLPGPVTSAAISSLRRELNANGETAAAQAIAQASTSPANYAAILDTAKATTVRCS